MSKEKLVNNIVCLAEHRKEIEEKQKKAEELIKEYPPTLREKELLLVIEKMASHIENLIRVIEEDEKSKYENQDLFLHHINFKISGHHSSYYGLSLLEKLYSLVPNNNSKKLNGTFLLSIKSITGLISPILITGIPFST